jgi:hypothetical protein
MEENKMDDMSKKINDKGGGGSGSLPENAIESHRVPYVYFSILWHSLGFYYSLAFFAKNTKESHRIHVYSGETGHSFRFKAATDRSEATPDGHYTSLWPE